MGLFYMTDTIDNMYNILKQDKTLTPEVYNTVVKMKTIYDNIISTASALFSSHDQTKNLQEANATLVTIENQFAHLTPEQITNICNILNGFIESIQWTRDNYKPKKISCSSPSPLKIA
jgi:hypothetical protein